jgi:hypothetical protein
MNGAPRPHVLLKNSKPQNLVVCFNRRSRERLIANQGHKVNWFKKPGSAFNLEGAVEEVKKGKKVPLVEARRLALKILEDTDRPFIRKKTLPMRGGRHSNGVPNYAKGRAQKLRHIISGIRINMRRRGKQ